MEVVSWLNLLMGIGLVLIAFVIVGIFGAISVDRDSSLGVGITLIVAIILFMIGVYSAMVGVGFL